MKKAILTKLTVTIIFLSLFSYTSAQNLQISGGNNFSAAVCDNQTVYVWGANASGQLGITAADAPVAAAYRNTAAAITRGNINNTIGGLTYGPLPAIRQIDAGSGAHIMGLSCTKQVWGWGDGMTGQLGRNATANSPIPQRVLRGAQAANVNANDPNGIFLNNIFYVSGGNNSSFALEETTGRVLAWGQNTNGQLGDGTTVDKLTPVYVTKSATEGGGQLTNIIQIEGGDDCTYALDANGNVWSWGDNAGNKLGRPGAGNQTTAGRVVQGDPMNNGYSATPTPIVLLNGITQISGGDTHCLALDGNGNVWSFGGDWGEGQLGRAGGSVYQDDARKVAIPGLATYATANNQFLGNGVDGRAVYVSAGQANSAVVMANGKVVTFGARGLYNSGATPVAPASVPITTPCPGPPPAGDMFPAGTLGDGNAACNSGACTGKATQWSRTPVYVTSNAGGTHLTGIASISDGDAWFYAVSTTGAAYTWGWNRRGELGLGDYADRCFATPFTLPTGCAFSDPCPGDPNLGPDVITCPVFSTLLNSNVPPIYPSFRYTWEYRPGTTGGWTLLGTANSLNDTYSFANTMGQYRISVTDNRASVPFLCAPCPTMRDTITFSPQPNPYTLGGCSGTPNSTFTVSAPASARIKWYTTATGGTALNPVGDSSLSWTLPTTSAPITAACGAGQRALFAEDVGSSQGILRPGTTVATAPNAGVGAAEDGTRSPLEMEATKIVRITEVSIIQPAQTYNYSVNYIVRIYANDPTTGAYNCGGCTPSNSKFGATNFGAAGAIYTSPTVTIPYTANSGALVRQIPINYTLPAIGRYWILVEGPNGVVYFTNNPASNTTGSAPLWNAPQLPTAATGLNGILATHDGNVQGNSHLFNIKFETGTGYTCGRILVCQSMTACPLPINLLAFNALKNGQSSNLSWSTSSEFNSDYFNVQSSYDGITWTTISVVKAAGNSNTIREYSYVDANPSAAVVYYRIEEVDFDGKTQLSHVEKVEFVKLTSISVFPNPNKGNFKLVVSTASSSALITLRNVLGQVIYQGTELISGTLTKEYALTDIAKGVYTLSVETNGDYKNVKINIE